MKGKRLKNIIITGLLTIFLVAGLFVPLGMDDVSAASRLDTPSYSLAPVYKGVKITWKSVPYATYYKVYKRNSSGTWKIIKTVKKGSTLRYVDKNASKCNASYRYQVRAFNSKNSSPYSSVGKVIKKRHKKVLIKKITPTCTRRIQKTYKCKYCGMKKTYTGSVRHDWVRTYYRKSTCQSRSKSKYYCRRCGKDIVKLGEYARHDYTEWKVIKKPNIKTGYNGYHKRTCKTCGAVAKGPIIDKNPIVNEAIKYVGNFFVLHGNKINSGIDCSHFVYQVLQKTCGFDKPYRKSTRWTMYGTKVSSLSYAKPGDILVFKGHLAIYMGRGKVVHCSRKFPYPKGGVRITVFGSNTKMINFFENTRHEKFLGIRRFKPTIASVYTTGLDGVYDVTESTDEILENSNDLITDEEETTVNDETTVTDEDEVLAPSEDELTEEELEELKAVESLDGIEDLEGLY